MKNKYIYALYPGHHENKKNDRKVKTESQICIIFRLWHNSSTLF